MLNTKLSILIVLILAVLQGFVFGHTLQTENEIHHSFVKEHEQYVKELAEKQQFATLSLKEQAEAIVNERRFQERLKSVRDKLAVTPIAELKKMTKNEWNTPIFNYLIESLQKHESSAAEKRRNYDPHLMPDLTHWLDGQADLLLAFAQTPLNDGNTASILVANAKKGMELQGGQHYEFELLERSTEERRPRLGIMPWSNAMYLALAYPVITDDTVIGTVILGKELSHTFATQFSMKHHPGDATMIYLDPHKGDSAVKLYESDGTELLKNEFASLQFTQPRTKETVGLLKIAEKSVFTSKFEGANLTVLKIPWLESDTYSFGFYSIKSDKRHQQYFKSFRTYSLLVAILMAILGVGVAIVFINKRQRSLKRLSETIWRSINDEESIDYEELKENKDIRQIVQVIEQLVIKTSNLHSPRTEKASWEDLMVNLDDEDLAEEPAQEEPVQQYSKEDEAYRNLFNLYMEKRRANGILEPMEFETFLRRVKRNIMKIKDAYDCKEVSFEVVENQGKVVLKPIITQ